MTRGPIRGRVAVAVVTAAALLAGGCPPCRAPESAPLATWNFDRCDDAAWPFAIVAGTARIGSTLHPGERGADSVGQVSLERSMSPSDATLAPSLPARTAATRERASERFAPAPDDGETPRAASGDAGHRSLQARSAHGPRASRRGLRRISTARGDHRPQRR